MITENAPPTIGPPVTVKPPPVTEPVPTTLKPSPYIPCNTLEGKEIVIYIDNGKNLDAGEYQVNHFIDII